MNFDESSEASDGAATDRVSQVSVAITAAHAPDLTPTEHNGAQSLVFEPFNNGSCAAEGGMISAASLTLPENNEHFHHHLVDTRDDTARPSARRGGRGRYREGRLGALVDSNVSDFADYQALEGSTDHRVANSFPVEHADHWNNVLQPFARVDMTLMSCSYVGQSTKPDATAAKGTTPIAEAMVKTFSPFYYRCSTNSLDEGVSSGDGEKPMTLSVLQRLAVHIESMQHLLVEKGLMNEPRWGSGDDPNHEGDEPLAPHHTTRRPPICRGVHSVHVDSSCRLIGVIDVDVCAVSLADVIAFNGRPLSQDELVAVLKSVVTKVALLHNAGVVHGCLHGGNVLCSADKGYTCLTGPCGIMSNPIFPADPSFISPRLASAMQPLVESMSRGVRGGTVEGTFPWVEDTSFREALLGCFGCMEGSDVQPNTNDDVYAIGILTLACALGVPPFCTARLEEVVCTLTKYYVAHTSGADSRDIISQLLGEGLFSCSYTACRMRLAGYARGFVASLLDFVSVCLRAGLLEGTESPVVAGDLLTHPLLTGYGATALAGRGEEGADDECTDEAAELARVDGVLHCLFYPISAALDCMRRDCGTTPFVPRLCRNSIFTARLNALQTSPLYDGENSTLAFPDSPIALDWPYLNASVPHWRTAVSCLTVEWSSGLYSSPCTLRHASCCGKDDNHLQSLLEVAKVKGMKVDYEAHTLIWQNKVRDRLILHRNEVGNGYLASADTLVLRNIHDCVVEILLRFRYVVLQNVSQCELLLGPCYFCYCDTIVDCPLVAVASAHLVTHGMFHVNLRLGFCAPPTCFSSESAWEDVRLAPYSIAYEGLSADYAAVPLPQEHIATVMLGNEQESPQLVKGTLELCNTLGRGQDYPYSHALAAFGNRFIHEDDSVSDVFLYPTEVRNKNIRIARIHGGSRSVADVKERLFTSDVTQHALWRSRHNDVYQVNCSQTDTNDVLELANAGTEESFPIVFLLDIVSDCVVEDCSNCAVIIIGSTDAITFRRCTNMRLFAMGREVLLEECESMEVYVFATEMLMLTHCHDVVMLPLALQAPCVEGILQAIVESTVDGALREQFCAAFEEKDVISLNALLRHESDTTAIDLQSCKNVHFDATCPLMFTVNFVPSDTEMSTFFFDAWQGVRAEVDWVVVPLVEHARGASEDESHYRCGAVPPVRFHDLVNVSIPRPSETLSGRQFSLGSTASPTLVEVVFERVVMGVIHIDDAIGTLFLRKCTGPLEIVVCAATRVLMESCEHVTVHTACCSFIAVDCHSCHTALHVNARPRYVDCTGMLASTSSLTSHGYEVFLERAGVLPDVNNFHEPVVERGDASDIDSLFSPNELSNIESVDTLEKAFAVLRSAVTLVPPLPYISLGQRNVPLSADMEARAEEEALRRTFDENIVHALIFLSNRVLEEEEDPATEVDKAIEDIGGESADEEQEPQSCPPLPCARPTPDFDSPGEKHADPLSAHEFPNERESLVATEEILPDSTGTEESDETASRGNEMPPNGLAGDEARSQSPTQVYDSVKYGGADSNASSEGSMEKLTDVHEEEEVEAVTATQDFSGVVNSTSEGTDAERGEDEVISRTQKAEESFASLEGGEGEDLVIDGAGTEPSLNSPVVLHGGVGRTDFPAGEFNVIVHPDEMELVSAAINRAAEARAAAWEIRDSTVTLMELLHERVEGAVRWLRGLGR